MTEVGRTGLGRMLSRVYYTMGDTCVRSQVGLRGSKRSQTTKSRQISCISIFGCDTVDSHGWTVLMCDDSDDSV
eukprot:4103751-Prymnesium_polylepis.1